jgi:hypothetical protein
MSFLAALATIPAAKLLGAAPKCQLFTNNITPGVDNVVGDFTAPTYTGYADVAVTLTGPYTNSGGMVFEATSDATFTVTTTGETVQVFGYILKDSILGYLGGAKFPQPITISAPSGALIVDQQITIDPTQLLGPAGTSA